jgi:iron complex outermembrane receptor protein
MTRVQRNAGLSQLARRRPISQAVHLACGALLSGGMLFSPVLHAQASGQAAAEAQAAVTLPTVTVSGKHAEDDPPAAYAGGQVARGARLGVLGNLDVMDTPFNITSYTAQLIEDQQARTLAEILVNDPSVRFTTSSGHSSENFRIRGFNVEQNDVAANGMFGMMPNGHVPVEFIERVEVLKGPNALFSGMAPSGGVGGVINIVPKRADDEPLTRATVGYQSASQLETSVDVGRRFGENKQWGVRVNGAYSDGETELDGQSKKREFASAAVDYRGKALKVSLDAYDSRESFDGGTPAMFWFAGTSVPEAPDASVNQFPAGYGTLENKAVMAHAEYEITSQLAVFAGAGKMNYDYAGFMSGSHVRNLNASGSSTTTATYAMRGYTENEAAEAGVRFKLQTGGVKHELVLQASKLDQEAGSASVASAAYATSIYDPVYKAMPSVPAVAPKTGETTLSSLALVDTMSMLDDRLLLTLGLRRQRVETTNYSTAGAVTGEYDKSAVTPAVGIVVKPWGPRVSLYANYVQGLSKGDSVSTPTYAYNYTFAPYKTEQKEAGIKWDAGTFSHTASIFQIDKPMLITLTGNVPSDGGEKRVRGVEWNTFGEILPDVRLLGGVSYTQGIQTKTASNQYNGNVAVGVPRWQANLGTEWDLPAVSGLTLSASLAATSSQYLNAANTIEIPGFGTLNAGARYATRLMGRKVVYRLNAVNLADKHYYSGSFSDTTPIATLGQGRTVSASASVDF